MGVLSTAVATAVVGIVTQNQVTLRAAPRQSAIRQAVLWQGEALEIRSERGDYLEVFDHRLERGGFVRASEVRRTTLVPEEAPELLAVVRFLRDTPGSEALGISFAAAYIKAASATALTAEPFDALGQMAERLARRATYPPNKAAEPIIAAHLEVVANEGLSMRSFEREGSMQICYDGEMFRRVLSMPSADATQRAHAALGLTRHDCVDPRLGLTARAQYDQWRADILERVPAVGLSTELRNRVHTRRAGVLAAVAFWQTRQRAPESAAAGRAAAARSIEELAAVNSNDLDDDDRYDYAEAAVRVGASRLAAEPSSTRAVPAHTELQTGLQPGAARSSGHLTVNTSPGAPGQTCVSLFDARQVGGAALVRRCTFGAVWLVSASANAAGTALALAVQPLATWRELWVFRLLRGAWVIDVLPPGSDDPNLGYIECAGWEPNSRHMLVVREVQSAGRLHRRFELIRLDTLAIERQAGTPSLVPGFRRWQDPLWKGATVALR